MEKCSEEHRTMHRTLPLSVRCGECARLHAPDAGTVFLQRPVWCVRCDLKHRTLRPASGAHRPVQCRFSDLSAHESGGHRTRPVPHKERPVTPRWADIARAQGLSAVVFSHLPHHTRALAAVIRRGLRSSSNPRRPQLSSSRQICSKALSFPSSCQNSLLCEGLGFG